MKKYWLWIVLFIIAVTVFWKATSKPVDILLYPANQIESIDIIEVTESECSTMDRSTIGSILYQKQELAQVDPKLFAEVCDLLSTLQRKKVFNDPPYSTIGIFFRIKYVNGDYSLIGSDCMIVCQEKDGYSISYRNNCYTDSAFKQLLNIFIKMGG